MARNHPYRPVPGAFGKAEPKEPAMELPRRQPSPREVEQTKHDEAVARVYAILDSFKK